MKEQENMNEVVNAEENKKKNIFASVWEKTVNVSKKAVESVQKGTQTLVDQNKKNMREQKIKKLNPLFPGDFASENFHLPNIIEIVDDAIRRGIDICEGAIGWLDRINGVEVLHLYDEWVEQSGIQFVPVWKCDNVYCVDNFNRNRFINTTVIFGKSTEEKLAELEYIAYCLGAKSCSIEIVEMEKETEEQKITASAKVPKVDIQGQGSVKNNYSNTQKGTTVSNFVGHSNPKRPELKWFKHDDNINRLIDIRCGDVHSITSKILELSGSCCATMNKKVACTIDKILKVGGKASMEQQVLKEHNSKLIFEIKF